MKMSMKTTMVIGLAFIVNTRLVNAQQRLTYVDLVNRLTDLECLSLLPEVGESCKQWSSYDQRSRYDEKTGKYVDWKANGDGFGGTGWIRLEGEQRVLAEMEGPGCIQRIWSANPQKGHLRIYLDGVSEPVVDLPFKEYFSRKNEPFTYPALVHESARGFNCYVPIPYAKSCKIVADKGYGQFYHFNYTTFPKGTGVPTFTRKLTAEETSALAAADKVLSSGGADPAGKRTDEATAKTMVNVSPSQTVNILKMSGPLAITGIRVKLDLPKPPKDRIVLRELVLSIKWDGRDDPSVWAPLGDFFGTAPGANPYRSLPLGLTKDGWWYCYWYMPFDDKVLIELTNDGKESHAVTFEITYAPLDKPIGQYGRFHAKWHRDAFLPAEPERREIDWPMLKTTGRGRFCGVMLHVWNPNGSWWGEGDEKFFVDGEKFPSTYGTGSEDYFGYAWCHPKFFENAYHDQTLCENQNTGHVSVNRWQITDNIPFTKSFEGCIEKYYSNDRPTLYACTAYWYLDPGGNDPYQPVHVWERICYSLSEVKPPYAKETIFVGWSNTKLATETEGAQIRYTLDGSEPDETSWLYRDVIELADTMVIKARAFKKGCYPSDISTMTITKTTYLEPVNPGDVVNGLSYGYYEGIWERLPDFDKLKPAKSGTTSVIDLSPASRLDEFALKFSGYLDIPKEGIYTFYTKSDDGSKLYIGDRQVVDNDGLHGLIEESGSVALRAGKHPIMILFFENGGGQALEVNYRGPGFDKKAIPAEMLFRKP